MFPAASELPFFQEEVCTVLWPLLDSLSLQRSGFFSCWVCTGEQSGTGTGFHPSTPVSPVNTTPSTLHTHSLIYYRRYVIVSSGVIIKKRRSVLFALCLSACPLSLLMYLLSILYCLFPHSCIWARLHTHTHTHTHRVVHSRSTHFRTHFFPQGKV